MGYKEDSYHKKNAGVSKPLIRIPIIKSYHAVPFTNANEIPLEFASVDNDLAAENLASDMDMTAADIQDFRDKKK